jgi:protein-L-isoaspartate O-methyltransferase
MTDETLIGLLQELQRNAISDTRVLDAIARTPRELFISERALKCHAYADEPLPGIVEKGFRGANVKKRPRLS